MVLRRGLEYYIVSISEMRGYDNLDDLDKVMIQYFKKGIDGINEDDLEKIGLSLKELKIVEKCIKYAYAYAGEI